MVYFTTVLWKAKASTTWLRCAVLISEWEKLEMFRRTTRTFCSRYGRQVEDGCKTTELLSYNCLKAIHFVQCEFKAFLWEDHRALTLTKVLLLMIDKIVFEKRPNKALFNSKYVHLPKHSSVLLKILVTDHKMSTDLFVPFFKVLYFNVWHLY